MKEHDQIDSLLDNSKHEVLADSVVVVVNELHVDGKVSPDDGGDEESRPRYESLSKINDDDEDDRVRQVSLMSDTADRTEMASRTPWAVFFTHPVSLTLLLNSWVAGWIGFTLLSEMPSYLTDVLGFNLESAGILSVFPFLALFVSSLSFGKFFNFLQLDHGWRVYTVRQVAQYISIGGSSLCLIICGYLTDKYAAYCFMVLSLVS